MNEHVDTPESSPEADVEPSEDPKDVARAMLIAGVPDDDVAEETGLSKRSVWGLKGALARAGQIPTRAEQKKIEQAKPGPRELEFQERAEGVPFKRPRPPHVVLERILNEFGVKDRAKDIIVTRCERMGEMHPSELQRMLLDLESGTQKKEASYIAEEYFYALGQESDRAEDFERSYPMRRDEVGYTGMYGRQSTGYGDRSSPGGGKFDRDGYRQPERRPWERSRGAGEGGLSTNELMDILERRDRENERRRREDEDKQTVSQLTQDIGVLATELRNLKENPPVTTPPGETDYEKMLKHTIDRQDDRIGELLGRVDTDRTESKVDAKEQREYYEQILEKQQVRFKEELDSRGRPYDSTGYKQDEFRMAAEGMHELADVMRNRGSPIKILVEGAGNLIQGTGKDVPGRERGGRSSVADLVGADYVEE